MQADTITFNPHKPTPDGKPLAVMDWPEMGSTPSQPYRPNLRLAELARLARRQYAKRQPKKPIKPPSTLSIVGL
jgi:hypothetical protein